MNALKARNSLFKLSALSLAVGLGLGAITQAQATVVVDKHQSPETSVTVAGTGATVVDISSASAGGVSHNTFTQFDVDPTGVILNNSATGSTTTLGGDIAGNSNMSGGSATVILNEVNSRDPSQLNGMVEVAGDQAAVVIANPSGISCDGCGFINASRSTLVTGTAEMSNGELTGFNVNDGQVVITGKGMDDRSTGYTDIISRSVKVNAQLQAQDLRIVTGSNHVDYATLDTHKIAPAAFSGKPSLALDVSSLGGMYANKIQLIGTEDGVGVRNNGTISASDSLSLSADGQLENDGLIAGGSLAIDTHQNTLDNDHGTLQAEHALTINSGNIDNNVDGAIVSNGTIDIDTHGQSLDNAGQGISGKGAVTINADEIHNSSWIASDSTLTLNGSTLNNSGSIAGKDMVVTVHKVDNKGQMQTADNMTIDARTVDNAGTMQASNGMLKISSDELSNSGSMAGNDMMVQVENAVNSGQMQAENSLTINAETVDNTGGTLTSNGLLVVEAKSLDNSAEWYDSHSGGHINGNDVRIDVDSLHNDRGTISGGVILLEGQDLNLDNGSVQASNNISIMAQDDLYIADDGKVESSNGNIAISTPGDLQNDGMIKAGQNISITATNFTNNSTVAAGNDLTVYASKNIDNGKHGTLSGGKSLNIEAVRSLDNAGEINTDGNAVIKAKAIDNKNTGTIAAQRTDFYVDDFTNRGKILGQFTLNQY